jgi:hypothetical protein
MSAISLGEKFFEMRVEEERASADEILRGEWARREA